MNNILLMLDYIDNEIEKGQRSILGKVNTKAISSYVERIREELSEFSNEKYMSSEVQKAKNMLAMAEQRQEQLISETEVVKKANALADSVMQKADIYQKNAEQQIINNSLNMLAELERHIKTSLESVQKAIDRLSKNS